MIRDWLRRHAPGDASVVAPEELHEQERLLSAYAHRLRLTDARRSALRASVLRAASARQATRHTGPVRSRRARPRLAIALAGVVVLAAAGTVAAAQSGPGEPFYGIRLTLESLTLPGHGQARVDALLTQLNRRLSEVDQASRAGNESGVADALGAYERTLNALTAEGIGTSATAIGEQLDRHSKTLQSIIERAPSPAQGGLQQALSQTVHAQQAIQSRPSPPGATQSHGPPSDPGPPGHD